MSSKPEGYPLPWCDTLSLPYWWANWLLCARRVGWRRWQKGKDMQEIIPEIDRLIGKGVIKLVEVADA